MTGVSLLCFITATVFACDGTSGGGPSGDGGDVSNGGDADANSSSNDCDARKGSSDPCPCPLPPPTCGTPCNPDGMPPLCIYGAFSNLAMSCSPDGVWEREGYVNCAPYNPDASTDAPTEADANESAD